MHVGIGEFDRHLQIVAGHGRVQQQRSLSVYAEDFENSMILLGAGERIYYDARFVVTTQAPDSLRGWFSQRVGWAFGLIKVYSERFTDVRRVARRDLSAAYQFLAYTGVSCLALQPLKIGALLLLSLSLAKGFDGLLGLSWIPDWTAADPVYFAAAYTKYTLLALVALGFSVPRGERTHVLPVLPLYFFYALMQIVPNAVGSANWLSLRLWGRRVFADHYQDDASLRRQHETQTAPHGWGLPDRFVPAASLAMATGVSMGGPPLGTP